MAQVAESRAVLRIFGDDLVPEEVTRLLGAAPTHAAAKGQEIHGSKSGRIRVTKSGLWQLHANTRLPEDIDGQVDEILRQLTDDISVWRSITNRFETDLFCGLFLRGTNEGLTMSPTTLAALGQRGIEINLDIYSGDGEGESDDPCAC